MSRVKLLVIGAAAALVLTIAQPRPAEAGDAGKIIAGIAAGAIAAAIVHNHHRHTYYAPPHAYYYAPPHPTHYYAPHPAPRYYYGGKRYYPAKKRYYSSKKRYRSYKNKPSRYILSHPSQFRSKYGFSPDSAQGKAFIKSFR